MHQMPTDKKKMEEAMLPHYKLNVGNTKDPIMPEIVKTRKNGFLYNLHK